MTAEPVEVIVSFRRNEVFPRLVKWGKRWYKILSVNLVHTVKEGAVRIYFFSVSDGTNTFKLGFSTETLKWWVEDFYTA